MPLAQTMSSISSTSSTVSRDACKCSRSFRTASYSKTSRVEIRNGIFDPKAAAMRVFDALSPTTNCSNQDRRIEHDSHTALKSTAISLVHLARPRLQVILEWNLEVEELVPVRVADLVQVQLGPLQRVVQLRYVVEKEPRACGVRLHHQSLVFERVEIRFDLLV